MPYRQVRYFAALKDDPARLEHVAQNLAVKLDRVSDNFFSYSRTLELFSRHLNASRSPTYNATVLELFSKAAHKARTQFGLVAPTFALIVPRRRGVAFASDRLDAFMLGYSSRAVRIADSSSNDARWISSQLQARQSPVTFCEDCGNPYLQHQTAMAWTWNHGGMICSHCRPYWRSLDWYDGRLVHRDLVIEALNRVGEPVEICEDDGMFVWSDRHDQRVHRDFIAGHTVIRQYHSSKPHFRMASDDWTHRYNRFMGVELEVESRLSNVEEVARSLHQAINAGEYGRRVFFERDGSLSNGFEMITHPSSLPALGETFRFLQDRDLVRPLRSHGTTSCGLHVHVSRAGLTNLTVARAVLFVNDATNADFIAALARRYNTGYCRVYPKTLDTAHCSGDRYEAVNLTGRHTLEFRLFRGSLKYEAVMAALEFCHGLLEYCGRPELTARGLAWRPFLDWCAADLEGDTRILREYVAARMGLPVVPPEVLNRSVDSTEA